MYQLLSLFENSVSNEMCVRACMPVRVFGRGCVCVGVFVWVCLCGCVCVGANSTLPGAPHYH